jgi:hypothetical protein
VNEQTDNVVVQQTVVQQTVQEVPRNQTANRQAFEL